jgi:hypothetical protein
MKRFVILFLSTAITVLLVITVLAAGQSSAQASTQSAGSAVITNTVQSAPASATFGSSQFEGSQHEGNEHHSRGTSSFSLSDD